MIKVLFFVYSLDGGGAEKALIDLVENLDKSKYDITIQAFKDEGVYRNTIPKGVRYRPLLRFKHSFSRIEDSVYYYRVRSGSISHSYGSKMLDVITSLEDAEMFYQQNGQYDRSFFSNIKFLHYYY